MKYPMLEVEAHTSKSVAMTMAVLYRKLVLNITTSAAKITNAGRPNNSSASAMPAI